MAIRLDNRVLGHQSRGNKFILNWMASVVNCMQQMPTTFRFFFTSSMILFLNFYYMYKYITYNLVKKIFVRKWFLLLSQKFHFYHFKNMGFFGMRNLNSERQWILEGVPLIKNILFFPYIFISTFEFYWDPISTIHWGSSLNHHLNQYMASYV